MTGVVSLDPDSTGPILTLFALLVLYAFFAAAKEAIITIRPSRRHQLLEENHPTAKMLNRLAEDATRLLATEQLLLKVLGFSMVAIVSYVYAAPLALWLNIPSFTAVLLVTVATAFLVLMLGELLPKELARSYPEPVATLAVYPFYWVSFLAEPLARLVIRLTALLTGQTGKEGEGHHFYAITEEDLRTYVDAGEEEGVLKEEEKEMIYSIFDLADTTAREVMVPRIDVVAVEADTPVMDALDVILKAGHSRVPVFRETIDNIVGILYAKDLLKHWRDGGEATTVLGLAREPYFVPETKPLSDLLRELQTRKVHIAIVVDEYGGTAGLVTIEDILEEIVGEIQDEYDPDEFYLQRISDDEYIFSARMDLDDINDLMSADLPTDEADTLGGLVYNLLGRIPEVGDRVTVGEMVMTVLDVEGRRIRRVRVQRVRAQQGQENRRSSAEENPSPLVGERGHKPVSGSM
ncbi:MAG: HlyC/CorC family transporter [Chloroflexi bacterium]|nr:MAG: HlyC/CorC family transporter [Chloroflexota bacterium]